MQSSHSLGMDRSLLFFFLLGLYFLKVKVACQLFKKWKFFIKAPRRWQSLLRLFTQSTCHFPHSPSVSGNQPFLSWISQRCFWLLSCCGNLGRGVIPRLSLWGGLCNVAVERLREVRLSGYSKGKDGDLHGAWLYGAGASTEVPVQTLEWNEPAPRRAGDHPSCWPLGLLWGEGEGCVCCGAGRDSRHLYLYLRPAVLERPHLISCVSNLVWFSNKTHQSWRESQELHLLSKNSS